MRICAAIWTAGLILGWATAGADEGAYTQTKNVVYAEVHGTALVMDVFTPRGEKNGLGIVDVASGAWHSDRGKIEDHRQAGMYDVFCGRGYTVFAVRPGSVTKYAGDEMLRHMKRGIRYVKAHASEYGIDPDRLGIAGASAGGHLATLAVVTAEEGDPEAEDPLERFGTQVAAAAVFFPPTDFLDWEGRRFNLLRRGELFFTCTEGRTEEELEAKAEELSPARRVQSGGTLPPFLFIHGDADPLVPLQQSEKMIQVLKDAGASAELIVKPGGAHPWPTIREEVEVMADWLDARLASG